MSIVEAIDGRINAVDQEIAALERQLEEKRGARNQLQELREQAEPLENGQGGGLPETATPPRPKPAKSPAAAISVGAERDRKVLTAIAAPPSSEGISPAAIRERTGLSKNQLRESLVRLLDAGEVRAEGSRRSRRYFPKGTDRPNPAPAQRRAAPALAKKDPKARRNTEAKQDHEAHRNRIRQAIIELLADGPLTADQLTDAVLERIPEAGRREIAMVRSALGGAKGVMKRRIDKRGDTFHLLGQELAGGLKPEPATELERKVVTALGSGRTASEVAKNVDAVLTPQSAATILCGLARREVIRRRPGSSPAVFEQLGNTTGSPAGQTGETT